MEKVKYSLGMPQKEYCKQYYQQNRERMLQKMKEGYSLEKVTERNNRNREEYLERRRQLYRLNKEKKQQQGLTKAC